MASRARIIFIKRIARWTAGMACLLLFLAISPRLSAAQDGEDGPAPPPLKVLSKSETAALNAQADGKRRTELALRLMDARLKNAEALKGSENFDAMFAELGIFHGLMDNTSGFIRLENRQKGKAFTYFKKYEMGLRAFTTRLELIRRDLPDRYGYYLKALLRQLRDARSNAIEPFFGDTVVPQMRS